MVQKSRQRCGGQRQDRSATASVSEHGAHRPDNMTSLGPAKGWWATAIMVGLPALLAAAVFLNTLSNQFVYDDKWTLDRLPHFAGTSLWHLLLSGRGATYLVHLLDQWLWGLWEPGYHLTNIVLHSLASSLAAYVAFVLVRSARAALLCGLLFAVHPVHVEVVAMFSYRKDIRAMIFVSLALICWLGRRRQVLCYLASISCLGLGLLSKEVAAVGLIPMLFLADLLPVQQHNARWTQRLRRGIWRILPIVILGIIMTTVFAGDVVNYFTPQSIEEVTGGQFRTYDEVLATTAGSVPDLVRLLFIPVKLSVDYSVAAPMSLRDPDAMLGVMILVLWIAACGLLLRPAPVIAFAATWPVALCLPCSNIVPLTKFFVAERYLYVPSFGVCLLVSLMLIRLVEASTKHDRLWSRSGAVLLVMLLLVVGGTRSFLRNRDWRDDYSIWSSCLRSGIDSPRIRNNLGIALVNREDYDEALKHFERALSYNPYHLNIRFNVAKTLIELGRVDEAAEHCRRILEIQPNDWRARLLLDKMSRRQT